MRSIRLPETDRRIRHRATLLSLLLLAAVSVRAGETAELSTVFVDEARDREVPVRIVYPTELTGPRPVVLISHGLGGNTEAMEYLGTYLAEGGWVAVHMQHRGSDASVWEGHSGRAARRVLRASLADVSNAIARFEDPAFVLDALAELQDGDGPIAGRLDLGHVGFAGHSYGARGALVIAGERIGPLAASFRDPRVDAVVALSPSLPRYGEPDYGDVEVPVLHVTGTEDGDPLAQGDGFDPDQRIEPFRRIEGVEQYLLVLDDADHSTFSGRRLDSRREKPLDRRHTALVVEATRLFLETTVRGHAGSRTRLIEAFPTLLADGDRWAHRPAEE